MASMRPGATGPAVSQPPTALLTRLWVFSHLPAHENHRGRLKSPNDRAACQTNENRTLGGVWSAPGISRLKICPSDSNVQTSCTTAVLHVLRARTGLTSVQAPRGTQPRGQACSRDRPASLCGEHVPYPQTSQQHGVLRGEHPPPWQRTRPSYSASCSYSHFPEEKTDIQKEWTRSPRRPAGRGQCAHVDDSAHLSEPRRDSDKSDADYGSGWLPKRFL